MDSKIAIIIGIIAVIIAGGGYAAYQVMESDNGIELLIGDEGKNGTSITTDEQSMNQLIEDIQNKTDVIEYTPKQREWQVSGPFEIDRKEYILGEKIFMRVNYLNPDEKGQVALLRPLNETHYSVYQTVPFDGSKPKTFNVYFEPDLNKAQGICTKDDLVGKWAVVFRGTDYENLYFNVTDQILPGDEESYEPVC